ncbi:MAG: bifunctional UDP-N-acetylglucosamine diphosphorylase/glucosamine-1-phosphate N-acetyltransferase GlmU [Streptosporangiales bacterium]|nr:bifunctional UDP-N-acetylglucosamine diphosphorylase/glucosamine-1-phosphate N-acetyltransferase GlmU [Streptosporangiales bacterium]
MRVSARPPVVVVLAAGEGKRMRSATPKVLHELAGRSMLGHVLAATEGLRPARTAVVVGHGRDQVTPHLAQLDAEALPVVQAEQHGTGHAARLALEALGDTDGTVLVVPGDAPLLTTQTLARLVERREESGAAVVLLTTVLPDPTGYGRVVRGPDTGEVDRIVEHKDATEEERGIAECAVSVYAFDAGYLAAALTKLTTDNAQGEEYLTDVVAMARADGHGMQAVVAPDHAETLGVNDRVQLAAAGRVLNDRLLEGWMRAGVTVVDPATTWVDADVTCEEDVTIQPFTLLRGSTHLARDAEVGPSCTLVDTSVGAGARVLNTHAKGAQIGPRANVGPWTYLRPGADLAEAAKAGAYVEIKNSTVGPGAKVPHLSYIGDAEIGEHSNIGAATVVVNYDGVRKHVTRVGAYVRIGSDTMLVAPVEVGDGAYTAAGSVITGDVPPGAMAVARGKQRNVEGWVERRRSDTPSAEAARKARERAASREAEGETGEG